VWTKKTQKIKSVHSILIENVLRRCHFVDLGIWRDNIKIGFKEIGCEDMNWIEWCRVESKSRLLLWQ
jgi:hypothetical protein